MTLEEWKFTISVVGSLISALGFGLTIFSLFRTAKNIKDAARTATYTDLDNTYHRILTLALDRPLLRDPAHTQEYATRFAGDERKKYDAFAFLVWNFLETIIDRCKKDSDLMETWAPVLRIESAIHRSWFDDAANVAGFKEDFKKYVAQHPTYFPLPAAPRSSEQVQAA